MGGLAAACGAAPPPPPEAAPTAKTSAVATQPTDLTAVAEPKGLIVFARIAKPRDALKTVGAWTHFPMPGAEVVAEAMASESVGKIIDLDKPIDAAVLSDPGRRGVTPQWAVAAAVTSLDEAKSAFATHKLLPGDNGALVIEGVGGPANDDDDSGGRFCELAPSAGDAPTRLVCGPSDGAVRALAPLLTRTTPRASVPSDLRLEVRLGPLKAFAVLARAQLPAILRGLGVNPARDPGLGELIDAATGELVDLVGDLDRVAIDMKLEEAQATATALTTFSSQNSLTARVLTEHPERVDLPPAPFWKLPNDADLAFFQRGLDAKDIDRPRELLLKAIAQAMAHQGLPEADSKALTDTFGKMLSGAPVVVARGVDAATVQKAQALVQAAKDDSAREAARRAVGEALMGWWVIGVDEPAARWQGNAKELMTDWNHPAMAKWLKAQAADLPAPTLKLAPELAAQLPKDTSRMEMTFYEATPALPPPAPNPKGPPPKVAPKARPQPPHAIKTEVLIVPDGARTWLVFAATEAAAVAKARAVVGSADSATLTARPGLESLKDTRVGSGGFVTLRGLASLSSDAVEQARRARTSDPGAQLLTSGQGESPIPIGVSALAGSSNSPAGSLSVVVKLPRPAIEDVVHAVMRGGKF
jgi:hypothetical protein